MKKHLHNVFISALLLCGCNVLFSQRIVVDNTIPLQQLIENNLVKNSCVDITDIRSYVNGRDYGIPSYAYFERGTSNFPFQNGIMLSTGNAESGGNSLITPMLSDGSTAWGTDPDLETFLGITNTLNATSIEFDIVSISNQLQFNYLFASEEYFGINPCEVSDSFVFLIKEAGSPGPYQNIAVVPGTTTPVNSRNIHPQIGPNCPAINEQYFEGYNLPDTNYNGRTTVLTAAATISPNVQYHIKLVIADQINGILDSAVFIEGDSFKILDLGDDITTCAGSTTLNADIQNPLAIYAWYRNNVLIAGVTSPTLNVTQNGTYKVAVTVSLIGTSCVEEDEIVVTLNSEESIDPITDLELCDTNGTGMQTFDLSLKDDDVRAVIGDTFTSYDFSYHLSEADARDPNSATNITTATSSTSNPQTIYVRIDEFNTDCFAYTTFNLIVNQPPTIVTPTPLEVCDSDEFPDGVAVVDLTDKDDDLTGGNPDLYVTYHASPGDAISGDSPLSSPYIDTNTPFNYTVYPRIINNKGCVTITSLDVVITVSPIIANMDTRYIDACDKDYDGLAIFDLTQVITDIETGLTNVTTTFHESYADAQSGSNPIANTTNYQNIYPEEQTIYVRVQDITTGCASIVNLEIHTNLLLTATDTGDYALCDNNLNPDDTLPFNLISVETFIANDLPFNITVTFYENETDRDNDNAIPKGDPYLTVSPKLLYIKIENDTGCSEFSDITLLINPIIYFNSGNALPYCDTDDDGVVDIDLHSYDYLVTDGNTDFEVTYFLDPTDAENNDSNEELPDFYPSSGIRTFYARIENIASGCHTVNSFEIEVIVAPSANQPTDINICDDYDGNPDGFSVINLNNKISEVVTSTAGLHISFHTSFTDADSITVVNPIQNPSAYNANTQTIYIRVADENPLTGCYAIVPLEVIVNTKPIIPSNIKYQFCDSSGSTVANFLLSDKDADILNGQTGKEVFYFQDPAFTIPIDKNDPNYQNTSSPQTIYVRVENLSDPTCSTTGSIILQVSPNPIYNASALTLEVCDDASNDEKYVFDLNAKKIEVAQGSTDNLIISFYLNEQNAENKNNPLPNQYTNISNPQSIYVRIESSDSFCYIIEPIGINIIAAPDITQVTAPLITCDVDYDGLAGFNLEDADFEINDRVQTNLITNYFENLSDINQNDGLDNSLEIPNPTNYISNTKTVYIKVANTISGCFSVIPLELIVNLPPAINTVGPIAICDNDTDTYDLTLVNAMIVNNTSGVSISYHDTQNDADTNANSLPMLFNYTTSSHTIFTRVSDNTTNCFFVSTFTLQINQNPVANNAPDLISCDDDFDGFFEFDLSANANAIIGSQNASNFSLTYYSSLTDSQTKENPLNSLHSASNGEIIYARLENNNTDCYDTTEFAVRVNPLPMIPINDVVAFCNDNIPLVIDAYTGNSSDTYLWSTGATTAQIVLNDVSEIGDYWVTATTPHVISSDCSFTKFFTVIESEIATINFTTTVDFADPNSITVDISGIGDYVYILDAGEPQTSNVFDNVTFGVHLITIRDLNGCDDVTREVVVIDIPKFFTPNNDGIFDTWHIVGIEQLNGTVVYIYNRYGKLLKTLPDSIIGWNGTFNGENMPSDDYWFVAKVIQNGEAFEVKGHFALKR